jgi:hypothetical protein
VAAVADVTFAITLQLPEAGIALPACDNVIELPPAAAVTVPPQVVLAFGLAAMTTPAGNESTSGALNVAAVPFALVKVIVRVEIPPGPLVLGLKAFVTTGRTTGGLPNAAHVGTSMVFESVVTVEPNANALPCKCTKCPNVILRPAAVPRKIFPTNVGTTGVVAEFAPSVVPPTGAQNTSVAQAPTKVTRELASVVSAPPGLKT